MVQVAHIEFQDFEDMEHCFNGADFQIVPLSTGPFRGYSTIANLGDVIFSTGEFCGDIRSRGVIHSEGMAFGVQLNGPCSRVIQWDADALPGDIFVMPGDVEQDGRAQGQNRYATISVSVEALERMGVFETLSVPHHT